MASLTAAPSPGRAMRTMRRSVSNSSGMSRRSGSMTRLLDSTRDTEHFIPATLEFVVNSLPGDAEPAGAERLVDAVDVRGRLAAQVEEGEDPHVARDAGGVQGRVHVELQWKFVGVEEQKMRAQRQVERIVGEAEPREHEVEVPLLTPAEIVIVKEQPHRA